MRLTVDGHDVFASTGGRPFDPAQPCVVLIHGAGMDGSVWALQSRWLAHHGRSVVAVDLPGHGRSGGEALRSIPDVADWVARLLDALGVEKAAVAGHSMGGLVSFDMAVRHPGRVRALGLVGVAAAMPVSGALLGAAEANRHEAVDMVAIWGHGFSAGLGGCAMPGLWMLGDGTRLLERAKPGVLHADLAACNAYGDMAERAKAIACPAVVVIGQRDMMTPARSGRALAAAIPGARLVELAGAGHMLMIERPDEVLDALAGTL
jgi:pimeloyl-ACP methyl ester carboxylesterase